MEWQTSEASTPYSRCCRAAFVLQFCCARCTLEMATLLACSLPTNATMHTLCVCCTGQLQIDHVGRSEDRSGQYTWIISIQAFQAALTRRLMKLPSTCCPMRLRWAACPSPSSPLCRYRAWQCSTACSAHAELGLPTHDRHMCMNADHCVLHDVLSCMHVLLVVYADDALQKLPHQGICRKNPTVYPSHVCGLGSFHLTLTGLASMHCMYACRAMTLSNL